MYGRRLEPDQDIGSLDLGILRQKADSERQDSQIYF